MSGTLYVDSRQYVRLSTQRNSIMTFSDIYFQDAYISNTNFIYASKEANSYVKSLISGIDLSKYAIKPEKYEDTRREMSIFLCDTINQSIYALSRGLGTTNGDISIWYRKLPISNIDLRKKWSSLLVKTRSRVCIRNAEHGNIRRGIDILRHENLVKWHGYVIGNRCSSYSIDLNVLDDISAFQTKRLTISSVLNEERVDLSTGEVYSINSLLKYGSTSIQPHKLECNTNSSTVRAYKKRIDTQLKRMKPVMVDIYALVKAFVAEYNLAALNPSRQQALYCQTMTSIFTILAKHRNTNSAKGTRNGISYTIEYYPRYKMADIGGRIFEIGGGIQFLKSSIRSKCRYGYDYDLESSQLNILKELGRKHGVKIPNLDLNELAKDMSVGGVKVSKSDIKPPFYGIVFGAGNISTTSLKMLKADLRVSDDKFNRIVAIFREKTRALRDAIKQLVDKLMKSDIWVIQGKATYHCVNCLGLTFKTNYGRYHLLNKTRKAVESRDKRRILAHIIQGIEMDKVLKLVEHTGVQVSSFEHDGVLVMRIGKKQHDYLYSHNMIRKEAK